MNDILRGYEDAADELAARFERISSETVLAPVLAQFPQVPGDILDVGAGTGRDAAWLAAQGHRVVAAEPVDGLRDMGQSLHGGAGISWVKDTLPELPAVTAQRQKFDLILLCAVWQHLDDSDRQTALSTFRRLMAPRGKLVMSIRHGSGAATRAVHPAQVSDTIGWAEKRGFKNLAEVAASSVQAENQRAEVSWTWLVFQT